MIEIEKVLVRRNAWPYALSRRFAGFGSLVSPVPPTVLVDSARRSCSP